MMRNQFYRKIANNSRGYYSFLKPSTAATIQERLLLKLDFRCKKCKFPSFRCGYYLRAATNKARLLFAILRYVLIQSTRCTVHQLHFLKKFCNLLFTHHFVHFLLYIIHLSLLLTIVQKQAKK